MATNAKKLRADDCRPEAGELRLMAVGEIVDSHRIMIGHIAETWDRIAKDIEEQKAH